jgi:hypothetical protein
MIEPLDMDHKIVLTAVVSAINNMHPIESRQLVFYSGEVTVRDINNEYMLLTQHVNYEITDSIFYFDKMEFIHMQMMYHGRKGNTRQMSIEKS